VYGQGTLNNRLRVVEQRLTFAVSRRVRRHNTLEPEVSSGISSGRNVQRADEEDCENDKGKDPLESDDLDSELLDSKGKSQNGQGVAEDVILGRKDVDKTNQEDHPDEDIGHDPCGQGMSMHGNSSIPEQGRKRPCIGSCNGRPVHKRRRSAVSPVCRRLADDVDDEDNFSGPEVATDPEHDECKD